jgi:hypothetical protein
MSQILSTVTVIGIDLGKNSFHVVGLDGHGAPVLRRSGREVRSKHGWPICPRL